MKFVRILFLLAALLLLPEALQAASLAITTASPMTAGVLGAAYAQSLAASGGTSPYTWSVSSGAVPGGLTLSSAGVLNGTPTAAGTFSFTAQVADSASATASKTFSVTIYLVMSANGIGIPSPTDPTTYATVDNGSTVQVPAGMVYIPAGSFTYGPSTTTPVVAATAVTLPGYCLGRFHVTNAEFLAFITDTGLTQYIPSTGVSPTAYWVGGTYPAGKANHPVNFVSLSAARAYAAWVSRKTGFNVVLPTAYQWEKAARGLGGTKYPWGGSAGATYSGGVLTANFNFNANVSSYYLTTLNTPYSLTPAFTSASTITFVGGGAVTSSSPYYGNPAQYAAGPYSYYPSPMTVSSIVAISNAATPVATKMTISSSGAVAGYVDHNTDTGFIYTDLFAAINNAGGYTTAAGSYPGGVSGYGAYDMAGNLWNWTTTLFTAANGAEANLNVNQVRGGSWYATSSSAVSVDSGEGRADGDYNSVGFRIAMILPGNSTGLTLTTATLSSGVNGAAYTQTLAATGGSTPYNWSISSGTLPTGLTLSTDGVLSGTPTATGSFSFVAQVGDSGGLVATQSFTVAIVNPLSVATASALPGGAVSVAYAQSLAASGGLAPYTWSVTGGALPGGLTLSSAGVLSGTPNALGTFAFTARVGDSAGSTATQSFSLTVSAYSPLDHFTWDTVPASANAGTVFATQLTARDATGALVSSYNGSVSVTPASASGSSTLSPIVVTEVAPGSERQFEIQNVSNVTINTTGWFVRLNDTTNTTSPAVADLNSMNATTFSLPSSMAPGQLLRVTSSSSSTTGGRVYFGGSIAWGNVTGKRYGWVGIFDSTSTLRDMFMWGWTAAYTAQFSVTVNGQAITLANQWSGAGATSGSGAPGAVTVDSFQRTGTGDNDSSADWSWKHNTDSSDATSLGVTNTGLSVPFAVTGSTALTVSPASVTLTNGAFSGNLTIAQAAANVTLTAADSLSHSGVSSSFTVGAALPLAITGAASLAGGVNGTAYAQTLTATGGMNPYSWSVTTGTLPAGLALSAAGVLQGTPTVTGTFNFTVQAADSVSATATKALTLTVAPPPPTVTTQPVSQTVVLGQSATFTVAATGTGALSYQWYLGGVAIAGATGASYTIGTTATASAGSYYVTVSGASGTTASSTITLTLTEPFDAYLAGYSLTGVAPGADSDGDGMPNLLEFVLGGDPTASDVAIAPVITSATSGGVTSLVFSFYSTANPGSATWLVQTSQDLSTWSNVSSGQGGATVATTVYNTSYNLNVVTVSLTTGASLSARLRVTLPASAQAGRALATVYSAPLGLTILKALGSSDSILSSPLMRPAVYVGSATPATSGAVTRLSFGGTPFAAGAFQYASPTQPNLYFALLTTGAKAGCCYTITDNDTSSLLLDLNGDSLAGVTSAVTVKIVPHWTLGTLFPGGQGITPSSGFVQSTQILLPDTTGTGTNLAARALYYYSSAAATWLNASSSASANDTVLYPDSYFVLRNNGSAATSRAVTGAAVTSPLAMPLSTSAAGPQDNALALMRQAPVALKDSGLVSSGAFAASTGFVTADQLFVFDNSVAGLNKSASAIYTYVSGAWQKAGGSSDAGSDAVFTPGSGVILRKAASAAGASVFWTNPTDYNE